MIFLRREKPGTIVQGGDLSNAKRDVCGDCYTISPAGPIKIIIDDPED